jgi:hypothetical protein
MKVWKHRFLNLQNKRFLLQGIDYPEESLIGRLQAVIEFSLKSENIVFTEANIAALEHVPPSKWNQPHDSLTDVFTVMCGTGKILPSWNKNILKHAVYNYFKMYNNLYLENYVPSMEKRIGPLLADPSTNPGLVFKVMSACFNRSIRMNENGLPELAESLRQKYTKFIEEALALPQMREHLLLSTEKIASYFSDENMEMFTPLLIEQRDIEKERLKERMRGFKEEIAMIVWHPDNVMRWLEIGGWPLLNMMTGED